MVYHGRVKNGVIVLDESVAIPEGTEVRVEPLPDAGVRPLRELARALAPFAERPELPADLATEHDHYLYGSPKKQP